MTTLRMQELTRVVFDSLETHSYADLLSLARELDVPRSRAKSAMVARIRYQLTPSVRPPNEFDVPGHPDFVLRRTLLEDGTMGDEVRFWNRFTGKPLNSSSYGKSEGYMIVSMRDSDGKLFNYQVGNLILRILVGEPQPGQSCDHIDQNRLNNAVSNLRWATGKEQNANQRTREPSDGTSMSVTAIDSEGDETVYADRASAAAAYITAYDTASLRSVMKGIGHAINTKSRYRGALWKIGPQTGDSIVEWRAIPQDVFPNCQGCVVSRCGLIKEKFGRITAGYLAASGYRKYSGHRVHRIVAYVYVPENRDLRLYVDHKDQSTANNHADNLRWVTARGNLDNCEMPNQVSVDQYTIDGTYLATHASLRKAVSVATKVHAGPVYMRNIQYNIEGAQDTAYGFVWKHSDTTKRSAAEDRAVKRKRDASYRQPVIRTDPGTTEDIGDAFRSIAEAMNAFPTANKISMCCNGTRKTSGGFGWRYIGNVVIRKKCSRAAQPVAHTDLAGNLIPPLHVSKTAATKHLRSLGLDVPDLGRHLVQDRQVDLRMVRTTELHSRVRFARKSEIEGQGPNFGPDHTSRTTMRHVWKIDPGSGDKMCRYSSYESAAKDLAKNGDHKSSVKTTASKIAEAAKGIRQSAYSFHWQFDE